MNVDGPTADDLMGQGAHAQLRRDERQHLSHTPKDALEKLVESPSYASQASEFMQQKGEIMKNAAQEATDAVKNTLGMSNDNEPPTTYNHKYNNLNNLSNNQPNST